MVKWCISSFGAGPTIHMIKRIPVMMMPIGKRQSEPWKIIRAKITVVTLSSFMSDRCLNRFPQ
jgi:hypothetical protein